MQDKIITVDPTAGIERTLNSTLGSGDLPPDVVVVYPAQPAPRLAESMLLPVPGANFANGDITHKRFKDMNRKERRALLSNKRHARGRKRNG